MICYENVQCFYIVKQFTHLAIWGSIAFWFLFLIIYPQFWPDISLAPEMVGMVRIAMMHIGRAVFPKNIDLLHYFNSN